MIIILKCYVIIGHYGHYLLLITLVKIHILVYFLYIYIYIYIYIYTYIFTILFYTSYSILYICIKLKVDCIDPYLKHDPKLITSHNKAMLITLSGS